MRNQNTAKRYSPAMRVLALAGAMFLIDTGNRVAKAETIEVLIELARNDAPEGVVGLSGTELASILGIATEAELAMLVSLLPAGDLDALVAAIVVSGAEATLIADVAVAGISTSDPTGERLSGIVVQNAPPDALPGIAAALVAALGEAVSMSGALDIAQIEALTKFALRLDPRPGTIDAIIAVANAATGVNGTEAVGGALARIAGTATAQLASAIETSLAISGNDRLSASFGDAAGVPPVADVPAQPSAPAAQSVPIVPAAAIGGGGAGAGGVSATRSGERSTLPPSFGLAGSSPPGGGVGSSPGLARSTDRGRGPVVSPQ